MAKQSGLHQIRGKVGEHSYYKQTGVDTGLIRSINQGMSNRVKTGAEYANTRLNNAEFGHACKIAGVLGHTLMPKFRPMILPFSQSKMAKIILDAIKLAAGSWGQRSLDEGSAGLSVLQSALRSVVKNNPDIYGITATATTSSVTIVTDNVSFPSLLETVGADGVLIRVIRNNIQVGNYVEDLRDYQYSYRVYNSSVSKITTSGSEVVSMTTPQLPPLPEGEANDYVLDVLVIMPYRTVNEVDHVLQETCTFIVL